jgi:hypothetical protein
MKALIEDWRLQFINSPPVGESKPPLSNFLRKLDQFIRMLVP